MLSNVCIPTPTFQLSLQAISYRCFFTFSPLQWTETDSSHDALLRKMRTCSLLVSLLVAALALEVPTTLFPRHHTRHSASRATCSSRCECLLAPGRLLQVQCEDCEEADVALPPGLEAVALTSVEIRCLRGPVFPDASPSRVTWRTSGLRVISEDLFRNLSNLEYLDVGHNEIESFHENTFGSTRNLRVLNITHNKLHDLPESIFRGLAKLENLSLSHNEFPLMPFLIFSPLEKLLFLDLSHNVLISVQDEFFSNNIYLLSISLANNVIKKIAVNSFHGLSDLRSLDLSGNLISDIPRNLFGPLRNLLHLDLRGNSVANLNGRSFLGLDNLIELDLSDNPFKTLPTDLLHPCSRLRSLKLVNTKIDVIKDSTFGGLRYLSSLVVTHNKYLKELERFVFNDTPNLRHLDLRGNNLTRLPESVSGLQLITELVLSDNSWACDCGMLWFVPWSQNGSFYNTEVSCSNGLHSDQHEMVMTLRSLNCKPTAVNYVTPVRDYSLGSQAVLQCSFSGSPAPSITWVTPIGDVFHWNPDPSVDDIFVTHPLAHHPDLSEIPVTLNRIQVLDNGTLHLRNIERGDCGIYTCFATNPIANASAYVTLHLDPEILNRIKITSILVGAVCAALFLLMTLLVQLIIRILNK